MVNTAYQFTEHCLTAHRLNGPAWLRSYTLSKRINSCCSTSIFPSWETQLIRGGSATAKIEDNEIRVTTMPSNWIIVFIPMAHTKTDMMQSINESSCASVAANGRPATSLKHLQRRAHTQTTITNKIRAQNTLAEHQLNIAYMCCGKYKRIVSSNSILANRVSREHGPNPIKLFFALPKWNMYKVNISETFVILLEFCLELVTKLTVAVCRNRTEICGASADIDEWNK